MKTESIRCEHCNAVIGIKTGTQDDEPMTLTPADYGLVSKIKFSTYGIYITIYCGRCNKRTTL